MPEERPGAAFGVRRAVPPPVLPDATQVKLGVFLSNTKTWRARLPTDQLQRLANLGLNWAVEVLTEPAH